MVRATVIAIWLLCLTPILWLTDTASLARPARNQVHHGLDCAKGRAVLPGHIAPVEPACRPAESHRSEFADRYFITSDGVRLHYLEGGANHPQTIVFIPGWTMPAWIWMPQLEAFSSRYHTVAFDPRGQGASAVPPNGYDQNRRGRDIHELLDHLRAPPVTIAAWSLGVLDTLAMIHADGDRGVAALVLVDNSVGEEPPPTPVPGLRPERRVDHATFMRQFVASMFHTHPQADYLSKLTAASLHTPETASRLLLAYPVPRSYWREAVYATSVPLLYVIRPRWLAQGENLLRKRPNTEMEVFTEAGHALFVDNAHRFNAVLEQFLRQKVWP